MKKLFHCIALGALLMLMPSCATGPSGDWKTGTDSQMMPVTVDSATGCNMGAIASSPCTLPTGADAANANWDFSSKGLPNLQVTSAGGTMVGGPIVPFTVAPSTAGCERSGPLAQDLVIDTTAQTKPLVFRFPQRMISAKLGCAQFEIMATVTAGSMRACLDTDELAVSTTDDPDSRCNGINLGVDQWNRKIQVRQIPQDIGNRNVYISLRVQPGTKARVKFADVQPSKLNPPVALPSGGIPG